MCVCVILTHTNITNGGNDADRCSVAAEPHVQFISNWKKSNPAGSVHSTSSYSNIFQIKVAHLDQRLRHSSAHHLVNLARSPSPRCQHLHSHIYFIASHQVQHSLSILLVCGRLWLERRHVVISGRAQCCKMLGEEKKKEEKLQKGKTRAICFCVSVFPRKAVERELCNQRSNKPVDMLHCLSREWVVAPATAPQALQVNGRKLKFAGC